MAQPHSRRGVERLRCFGRGLDIVVSYRCEIDDIVRDCRESALFVGAEAHILNDARLIAEEGIHIGPRERDAHGTTGNPGGLRRKCFVRSDQALYAKRATRVLRDHSH